MRTDFDHAGLFRSGNYMQQNTKGYGPWTRQAQKAGEDREKSVSSIRRMLSQSRISERDEESREQKFQSVSQTNLSDGVYGYSDSLREARTKAKETALRLKKLQYDFKAISTQILRSKTSASAKQVAARARREVIRLKRQRQNGEYDDEELQSAITHAQAMERAARKKARHLEEEEMVKVTGGPCAGELEEKEETGETEAASGGEADREASEDAFRGEDAGRTEASLGAGAIQAQAAQMQEMIQARMEEVQEMMQEQLRLQAQAADPMGDMLSEMTEEMSESMQDMLEEMGLSELTESVLSVGTEMDPADYEMMKLKHRSEEMKAIAQADSEYLKALFNRLERLKEAGAGGSFPSGGGAGGGFAVGGGAVAMGVGAAPMAGIDLVSAPNVAEPAAGALSMPGAGGGFDISV